MGSADELYPLLLLGQYLERARENDWENTQFLIAFSTGLFGAGQFFALSSGGLRIQIYNIGLFVAEPELAWLLAIFLHSGFAHFVPNMLLLALYGPFFDPNFSRGYYAVVFVLTAVATIGGGAFLAMQFTDRPVAYYGISGFGFAMATFVGYQHLWSYSSASPIERFLVLVGGAAILTPVFEVVSWLLFGTTINGGHLIGAILGVVYAIRWSS